MSFLGYVSLFCALGFFGYELGSLIHDIIKHRKKKKETKPKDN